MEIKKRRELHDLIEAYDSPMLECDGMTRVISYILTCQKIEHVVHEGMVIFKKEKVYPHWWIQIKEYTLDYKLQKWLGKKSGIPYGIFKQKRYSKVEYRGEWDDDFHTSRAVFEILTGSQFQPVGNST